MIRAALSLLWCVFFSFAQLGSDQTQVDVLDRITGSLGWNGKAQNVRSLRVEGTFDGFQMTVLAQVPSLYYVEIHYPKSTVVEAYDGSFGWRQTSSGRSQSVTQLKNNDLDKLIDRAANAIGGPLVLAAQRGTKVESEGVERKGRRSFYRLKLTLLSRTVIHEWVDVETLRPERDEWLSAYPGAQVMENSLSDYRVFGGISFPCSLIAGIKGDPNRHEIKISDVIVNTPLTASIFTLHGASQAL